MKRTAEERQDILESMPIQKRERGEIHRPALFSRFAHGEQHCAFCSRRRLGGQNLAALGTAAGENLAAVGSSHSLTETVDLGTVTAAGLIGTLHLVTPPTK